MALLSNKQIKELLDIIKGHFMAFVHNTVSPSEVDPADIIELKRKKIIPQNVSLKNYPRDAYEFGRLVEIIKDNKKIKSMDYDKFKSYVFSNPIPLTHSEELAVDYASRNAATYITSLRDKTLNNVSQIIQKYNSSIRNQISDLEPHQQEWFREKKTIDPKKRAAIRDKVVDSIRNRTTVKELTSELYNMFDGQGVDFQRIAYTEKNEALCQGKRDEIKRFEKHTKKRTRVFKRPAPDACPHCKKHYLRDDGVTPKLFWLSELEGNGTNVGRKVADWKPVVGSMHPWCQCTGPYVMPDGFDFDEHGEIKIKKTGKITKKIEMNDKAERLKEVKDDLIEDIKSYMKPTIVRDDEGNIIRKIEVTKTQMIPYLKKQYKDYFSEDVISDMIDEQRGLKKGFGNKKYHMESKNNMDLKPHMKTIQDESLCKRCGMCCCLAIDVDGIEFALPSLKCKYLQETDKNKFMCTVYDIRLNKDVAGAWCNKGEDCIRKGHLIQRTCPYVKDIEGYKGRVVANKEVERAILKGISSYEKPEAISQENWDEVMKDYKDE